MVKGKETHVFYMQVYERKKKKGDNQKGGDQNRYRPFTTPFNWGIVKIITYQSKKIKRNFHVYNGSQLFKKCSYCFCFSDAPALFSLPVLACHF